MVNRQQSGDDLPGDTAVRLGATLRMARERSGICSGLLRKFFCTSRRFPQGIGNPELRDRMKTSGKTVTHRDL